MSRIERSYSTSIIVKNNPPIFPMTAPPNTALKKVNS